jgi:hypothetical protein
MADDLGPRPHTPLFAQLSGDALLANLGLFSSPDRRLLFDLNDFDETHPGPFEWDLKRLAVSIVVASLENWARTSEATVCGPSRHGFFSPRDDGACGRSPDGCLVLPRRVRRRDHALAEQVDATSREVGRSDEPNSDRSPS